MINLNPSQYPDAARKYAELSPDQHCVDHLNNWLEDNGRSLLSFQQWLVFRLITDNANIINIDGTYADLDVPYEMNWWAMVAGDTWVGC